MTYLKALNNLSAVFTRACRTHNTSHYHNWSLLFTSVLARDTGGQHITHPHLTVEALVYLKMFYL